MNLFLSTRAFVESKEDHLTEFFAAALENVEGFRSEYFGAVLAPFASRNGWADASITGVETQAGFPGSRCRPDMLLRLSGGQVIVCEHKLDAFETKGPEEDPRAQLERYLELPIDGLVYVRSSLRSPGETVMNHARYVRPAQGAHFLWRDFYTLLAPDRHVLLDWLREGFETLGFTPPHPSVGALTLRPVDLGEKKEMLNFAKLWDPTVAMAQALGWRVGRGSIVELYLRENQRALAPEVFISPKDPARFLIRITPGQGNLERVLASVKAAVQALPQEVSVSERRVPRARGHVEVVEVRTTQARVLGAERDSVEVLERRLLGFVGPVLKALC